MPIPFRSVFMINIIIIMSIESIIKEEMLKFSLQESTELLGIPELAEYLSRVDPEKVIPEEMQGMLQQEYTEGGDEAVRKFFYEMTKGIDLNILGRGKYAFKY